MNFRVAALRFQLAHGVESAQLGHGDVGDDHVRAKAGRLGDQSGAVGHGTDHVELVLQQADQAIGDNRVIVGKQDRWRGA